MNQGQSVYMNNSIALCLMKSVLKFIVLIKDQRSEKSLVLLMVSGGTFNLEEPWPMSFKLHYIARAIFRSHRHQSIMLPDVLQELPGLLTVSVKRRP